MREKQAITRETAPRYQRANRKDKQRILDEFTQLTGYNRKYAIHLLSTWGTEQIRVVDGTVVRMVVGQPRERKHRAGRKIYDESIRMVVKRIWEVFDYLCGKRLAVLIRNNLELLKGEAEFGIEEGMQEKLRRISPATLDRMLKGSRKALQLKGRSHTRPGTFLKHQIPIRVFYDWDERKPGFFEVDTVSHDGGNSRGEFCCTLTLTDVYSGWVELRALRNRAHRWVKEEVERLASSLPFPLKGIDSDNGGEFINTQLLGWCQEQGILFTRGRSYRKNDNCFVEQKNDLAVRHTVGYYRFDSDAEYAALQEVYRYLCPLVNFYYPSVKLVRKERIGSRVQKRYDAPKTPCQRLLESRDVEEAVKKELRTQAAQIHIVKQKRLVDQAVARLLQIHAQKHPTGLSLLPAGQTGSKEERYISTGESKKERTTTG